MTDNPLTRLLDKLLGRPRLYHRRGGGRRYVTGTGQALINVHPEEQACRDHFCVIHHPSPEAEAIGPTHYNVKSGRMERLGKGGEGHLDPDAQAWAERTVEKGENK